MHTSLKELSQRTIRPQRFCICGSHMCCLCLSDFHFHFSWDTHLFIVPLLSFHWHGHLFFLHCYTTMPLANVWLCGPELTSCSFSSTCECSGGIDHFSPFSCCIWECGKRQTAVIYKEKGAIFTFPQLRCTVQCIACFCNTVSGNPSASGLPWMTFSTMLLHFS